MAEISTILLPTRPQPDTIVAIFLLKQFGQKHFPGVASASVRIQPTLPPGETFESLLQSGFLALDLGGGALDHHGKNQCASELVAHLLKIEKDPSINQLLAYAKRDDKEGKGTLSRDAIDRAFGLSGLIAAFNKARPADPQAVVDAALPLIEAHWLSAWEHHVGLPQDVERKRADNKYQEYSIRHDDRTLKLACVISDKPSMPTYLRSDLGGKFDVVLQKAEKTNHFCILTNQKRGINLSKAAGLIRLREVQCAGNDIEDDAQYLGKHGRIDEVPYWYFDPATNSLLNGGIHSLSIKESLIDWEEMKLILRAGLETGSPDERATTPYFLSINIPEDVAERIVSQLEAPSDVKVHESKNLHVTLHYFGQKTRAEAERIAQATAQALAGQAGFDLTLHDGQLAFGSPEGYTNTDAWYLAVEPEAGARIQEIRKKILPALGLPANQKMLHVTLAANRNPYKRVESAAVRFSAPVEMTIPVSAVALMESVQVDNKREYRTHSTFPFGS